jgi:hypothetical protein
MTALDCGQPIDGHQIDAQCSVDSDCVVQRKQGKGVPDLMLGYPPVEMHD